MKVCWSRFLSDGTLLQVVEINQLGVKAIELVPPAGVNLQTEGHSECVRFRVKPEDYEWVTRAFDDVVVR